MLIEDPTIEVAEYQITDIDYWEKDATLVVDGQRFYFQFSDTSRKPTLLDALRFLQSESKFNV